MTTGNLNIILQFTRHLSRLFEINWFKTMRWWVGISKENLNWILLFSVLMQVDSLLLVGTISVQSRWVYIELKSICGKSYAKSDMKRSKWCEWNLSNNICILCSCQHVFYIFAVRCWMAVPVRAVVLCEWVYFFFVVALISRCHVNTGLGWQPFFVYCTT